MQKLHANNRCKRILQVVCQVENQGKDMHLLHKFCAEWKLNTKKSISFETNQSPLPQNKYIERKGTNCAQNNANEEDNAQVV